MSSIGSDDSSVSRTGSGFLLHGLHTSEIHDYVTITLADADIHAGFKKPFLKPKPMGFLDFGVLLDKQEKIGKVIQKLSNLKP